MDNDALTDFNWVMTESKNRRDRARQEQSLRTLDVNPSVVT